MRKMRILILICLLWTNVALTAHAWHALAQEETPAPAPPPLQVPVGPYDFAVNGDDPLTACIVSRNESLDGIVVGVQVLIRTEGGDYVPVVQYTTRAAGALTDAHVDSCFILAARK